MEVMIIDQNIPFLPILSMFQTPTKTLWYLNNVQYLGHVVENEFFSLLRKWSLQEDAFITVQWWLRKKNRLLLGSQLFCA